MSVSPVPAAASSVITVTPSSLGSAAAALSVMTADVRAHAQRALGSPSAAVIGDARCQAALAAAGRLVGDALHASAGSLDQLGAGLRAADGAYSLADLLAFAPAAR
jgi:hypothetical protein